MRLYKFFVLFLALFSFCSTAFCFELNSLQKDYIDSWLEKEGLNKYGDPEGTVYLGGSPLFDETSGQSLNRYEYVLKNHPQLLKQIQTLVKRTFASSVFSEDVSAALDSNDYLRVCELIHGLTKEGYSVYKYEAEHLFDLNRQLRFRLLDHQVENKVDEVRQALSMLEPMLDSLKV